MWPGGLAVAERRLYGDGKLAVLGEAVVIEGPGRAEAAFAVIRLGGVLAAADGAEAVG